MQLLRAKALLQGVRGRAAPGTLWVRGARGAEPPRRSGALPRTGERDGYPLGVEPARIPEPNASYAARLLSRWWWCSRA
jgi:hypothetical protein